MQTELASTNDAAAATAGVAHDLSPIALFLDADPVVKIIMLGLLLASLWTWTIIIDKLGQVGKANKRARDFEESFRSQGSAALDLDDPERSTGLARIIALAAREWRDARRAGWTEASAERALDRAGRVMNTAIDKELTRLEDGLGVLAIVGSASTFVGLLGTVWGIMNAFQSIAASQDTSLAVVAPGIAEALFATAMGLFAAIPAVVFFNKFSGDIGRYGQRLDAAAEDALVRLSRRVGERDA